MTSDDMISPRVIARETLRVVAGKGFALLNALCEQPDGLTREEAAAANDSTATTADETLNKLEELGLVRKKREGRRVKWLITDIGASLMARLDSLGITLTKRAPLADEWTEGDGPAAAFTVGPTYYYVSFADQGERSAYLADELLAAAREAGVGWAKSGSVRRQVLRTIPTETAQAH